MRSLVLLAVLGFFAWSGGSAEAAAQDAAAANPPLQQFIQRFVQLWSDGEVTEIVQLIGDENVLLLDTGDGTEAATGRHAAAALRVLFGERQTTALEALSVTVASQDPPGGFGELSWTFRNRDMPGEQARSIYVAAIRDGDGWRISELRLLP